MADAEYFALQAAEARAERHIKVVQHHFAKLLCRVAGRCEEIGNRMAVFLRIKGDCFQTPNLGSTPHSAWRKSMEPSEEMVSTSSKAGCRARSMALRASRTRLVMPVEVSLCTTHTALML